MMNIYSLLEILVYFILVFLCIFFTSHLYFGEPEGLVKIQMMSKNFK